MKKFFLFIIICIISNNVFSEEYDYKLTGLPVCYIETENNKLIESKTEYVSGTLCIKENDDYILETSNISIRLRGNATIGYEKKPYKIKFESKTRPFPEMSKDKSFCLLANYTDKSLMRTAIGFKIGELLEYEWVPKSRFVELVLNGEYIGNYQFTENVKRSNERINISKDGFIIELDFDYLSSVHYFSTVINNWYFTSKYPEDDEMIESVFNYAEQYMNDFEKALYKPEFPSDRSYTSYIDETSFAKWYYWKNLLQMNECNRYFFKYDNTNDSKLKMGTLWDFEWCLGVGPDVTSERPFTNYHLKNKLYFNRLYKDPLFMAKVAEIHKQYGDKIYSGVLDFYDELSDSLSLSQAENFRRWPILDKPVGWAYVPLGSWQNEVNCDKQFFINHYEWLNNTLLPYLTGITEIKYSTGKVSDSFYSLDGRIVRNSSLSKGIYINHGRKLVVK